jgi:hypothetical protein
MLIGVLWVSVDWIIEAKSGNRPSSGWVLMIYEIGAMLFGLGGAALGAIVGSGIGILEVCESRAKGT